VIHLRSGTPLVFLTAALAMTWLSAQEPLTLARAIELPRVDGRIDHLAFDAAGQHLFVAALGNNTVEVLDVKAGTHVTGLPDSTSRKASRWRLTPGWSPSRTVEEKGSSSGTRMIIGPAVGPAWRRRRQRAV
jgi:hypothetical protein